MTTATAPAADASSVNVGVDELIVDRPLKFPLFDNNGVLLLAEGQLITSDFKQKLKAHRVGSVKLSAEDAKSVTLRSLQASTAPMAITIDSEIAKKLDAVIDGGLLSVSNKGPSVKSSVVYLGRKAYDQKQRGQLVNSHNKNSAALGDLMAEALHGKSLDGAVVSMMAAEYLKQMTTDADNTLTSTSEMLREDDLSARSVEVSLLAMALGVEMGLDANNIRDLSVAGLVHDWGMMKVPAEIRQAKRRLTPVEQIEIKKHPIHSLEMLQKITSLPTVAAVVAYQVHERFNGTGYPRGRRGSSIHMFARILQVADMYVALTSERPYRPSLMPYSAMELLLRKAKERSSCPDVVKALLRTLGLFPLNSMVLLSDGSVARVLRRNKDLYTQPIVQRVQGADGSPSDQSDLANIIDLSEGAVSVKQALPTPGKTEVALSDEHLTWNC
jgi:HD-GYP domain-containing protein (c-di-GMP phosphodiesterase class II)